MNPRDSRHARPLASRRADSRRALRASVAALLGVAALALPEVARAQTAGPYYCSTGEGCTQGFTCQITNDGSVCPPCTGGSCPVCGVAQGDCVPSLCQTDSDCAPGMVCFAETATSCPAQVAPAKCPADVDCGVAPEPDAGACTTTTTSSCVPQYEVPCHVDSDCGPGFTCVPDTSTECSGGGSASGAGSGDGSATGAPVPQEAGTGPTSGCTTVTSSTSSCQANTIACTTSSDCPALWSCTPSSTGVEISCPNIAVATVDGAAPDNGSCTYTEAGPSQSYCSPPYAYLGGYNSGTLHGEGSAPTSTASSDGGTPTGAAGAASDTQGTGTESTSGSSGGGCDVSGAGDAMQGATGMLWVLGLLGARRRRRS
jgi:MYXO-CTERM domain-containing protein